MIGLSYGSMLMDCANEVFIQDRPRQVKNVNKVSLFKFILKKFVFNKSSRE